MYNCFPCYHNKHGDHAQQRRVHVLPSNTTTSKPGKVLQMPHTLHAYTHASVANSCAFPLFLHTRTLILKKPTHHPPPHCQGLGPYNPSTLDRVDAKYSTGWSRQLSACRPCQPLTLCLHTSVQAQQAWCAYAQQMHLLHQSTPAQTKQRTAATPPAESGPSVPSTKPGVCSVCRQHSGYSTSYFNRLEYTYS